MIRTVVSAMLITSIASCITDPVGLGDDTAAGSSIATVRTSVGDTFRLRLGEVAIIKGTPLLVGLRAVSNDSRCPADAQCVWAGDATVTLGAILGERSWKWADLHTGVEPRQFDHGDYIVSVVGLEPNARQGTRIPPEDYVVVLRVTNK